MSEPEPKPHDAGAVDSGNRWANPTAEWPMADRSYLLLISAVVLLLTNLPFIWGYAIAHDGLVFSGFPYMSTHNDSLSYILKMREGMEGEWTYTSRWTTQPHEPVFLFLFYITLGHVARLTGLSLLVAFHLARILGGVYLLYAVARLLKTLGLSGAARCLAFLLVFSAGGIGWIESFFHRNFYTVESFQIGAFSFQPMLNFPHFVLTSALFVDVLTSIYRFQDPKNGFRPLVWGCAAAFFLAWVNPRPILTLGAIGGVLAIGDAIRDRANFKRWAIALGCFLLATVPPMALMMLSVRGDPFWTEWSRTETKTGPPLEYLKGFGLLWPLAAAGGALAVRSKKPWAFFVCVWAVVATLIPYFPNEANRRFIQAWTVPLALLAGYAMGGHFVPWMAVKGRSAKFAAYGAVAILCFTLSLSALDYTRQGLDVTVKGYFPFYYSSDRAASLEWLSAHTAPEEVVFASVGSGQYIPPFAGNVVVAGHWAETRKIGEKKREIEEFFKSTTPDSRRVEILDGHGAKYVLFSQQEKALGDYSPSLSHNLFRAVWNNSTVVIYEYLGADGSPSAEP